MRMVTNSLELDASGSVWSGTFGFTIADAAGVVMESGEGTVRASRIVAEPA